MNNKIILALLQWNSLSPASDGVGVIPVVVIHQPASLQAPLWCDVLEVISRDAGGRRQTAASSLWQECKHQQSPKEGVYISSTVSARDQRGFPPPNLSYILWNETYKGSDIAGIMLRIIAWACFVDVLFWHSTATCDKQAVCNLQHHQKPSSEWQVFGGWGCI